MTAIFDIATMGTSLSAGTGATQSFHLDLERALSAGKQSYVRTYNFGIGGGYTTDGIARVNEVIRLKPKVVTVEFTMNDCLVPLATAQANTISLLNSLKTGLPTSLLYLLILNKVIGAGSGGANIRTGVDTYNDMYRSLAVSQSVGLIDTYAAWAPTTLTDIPDGVHPTAAANLTYALPGMVSALSSLIT